MFIEQPPMLYRALYQGAIWRQPIDGQKTIYLTFDDGPIPHITPWVLDTLDTYEVKATFFCVGDNVRKHAPEYQMILDRGHRVGNHTYNHIQGLHKSTADYLENIELASEYINSDLFRPPHGHMKLSQYNKLKAQYKIIMWDVVTRDYSKRMTPVDVFNVVKKYTRDGSILVFHDSLKSEANINYALPKSIEWLQQQGYNFGLL